ncbi:MAG TPA: hypothetical protein VGN24_06465, partial [Rhodanobacter sp.]|nr:hypothetical protein [Rhodanobacter sp.]
MAITDAQTMPNRLQIDKSHTINHDNLSWKLGRGFAVSPHEGHAAALSLMLPPQQSHFTSSIPVPLFVDAAPRHRNLPRRYDNLSCGAISPSFTLAPALPLCWVQSLIFYGVT